MVKKKIPFSQLHSFGDLKSGGNCFAYVVLLLTYINMSKLVHRDEEINYGALKDFFSAVKSADRKSLNDSQSTYPGDIPENILMSALEKISNPVEPLLANFNDIRYAESERMLFNLDWAVLNETVTNHSPFANTLFDELSKEIKRFTSPIFYVLNLEDRNQAIFGQKLSHTVSVYLTSKTEVHVFDPNSGVHIVEIPENVLSSELKSIIFEIIFRGNFPFKCFFKSDSPSLYTSFLAVTLPASLTERQKNILEELKGCITAEKQCDQGVIGFDEKDNKFMNLNKLAIRCIKEHNYSHHKKFNLNNLSSGFIDFFKYRKGLTNNLIQKKCIGLQKNKIV